MADDDTVAVLRQIGIAAPDAAVRLTPLSGGVSCDVWRADIAGRDAPLVIKRALPRLRVAAEWLAPVERAENEVAWLRRVAAIDPRLVPEVLSSDPAAHLFVLGWCNPATHPVWRDELFAGRVDADFAAGFGRDLARIHAATAGDESVARDFGDPALFDALRIAPFLRYTTDRVPEAAGRLTRIADDLAACRIALVHGDVSPKNILIGPAGGIFLDAECAVYGDPAFDLAFCATHLLLKQVWLAPHRAAVQAAASAMIQGYLSGVDWEDAEMLSLRAGDLLAALLLARVEGKSPAPYLDDAARETVRGRALALLAAPTRSIGAINDQWGAS